MRNSLAAVGVSLAVLALPACNMVLAPSTPDANWKIYDRGHFTYYVRPGSFAEQSLETIGNVLDDQFSSTVAALTLRYDGHITVFLPVSGADGELGDQPGANHSGVAYPDTETVKAACVPPLDGNLFSLISHEVNHVIVRNGLGREGTTFINEGLASALLSERYHSQGRTFYYHWTATHRAQLPRIGDLVIDDHWNSYAQDVAYNTSASFLAYLMETYGAAPMRAIHGTPSGAFPAQFLDAYGITLDQAEAAWLAFCSTR